MHELVPIGVVGIVFYFTYKMIELPSRRREREMMIERMGRTSGTVPNLLSTDLPKRSFSGLRLGCLLIGVGLGLLVGLIINTALAHGGYSMNKWSEEQLFEVAYGAPVLIFGGLGLLCSYLLERRLSTDDKQRSERP
mgnify:FL=1